VTLPQKYAAPYLLGAWQNISTLLTISRYRSGQLIDIGGVVPDVPQIDALEVLAADLCLGSP
jgi:hypothetical protein